MVYLGQQASMKADAFMRTPNTLFYLDKALFNELYFPKCLSGDKQGKLMVQLVLTDQLLISHLIMRLMTPLLVILISLHLSHLKGDMLYNLTGLMKLLQITLRSLLSSMLCLPCQIQYQLHQSLAGLHD